MDLNSRLDSLFADKRRKERLLAAVSSGLMEGVQVAAPYFATLPDAPPPGVKLAEAFPHARLIERRGMRLFQIRTTSHIDDTAQPYRLPIRHAEGLRHGHVLLQSRKKADAVAEVGAERIAFLDTETTGLAGASGTLAFLVGVGFLRCTDDHWFFELDQYLVEDYCHEPLLMEVLVEQLSQCDAFCTYNGRSFDIPLLRTRGILNRMRPALWQKPNIDLLPHARRLWKKSIGSVSLRSVERNILGIARTQDVDGSEIPEIWHHFARTGECGRMALVLHHNAQDIASLASLLALQGKAFTEPLAAGVLSRVSEFAGMSKWFEDRGDLDTAIALMNRAAESATFPQDEDMAAREVARLHKRRRDWPRAIELWQSFTRKPVGYSLPAWIELAKYHEHRARDYPAARRVVFECLRQLELEVELRELLNKPGKSVDSEAVASLRHRLERLEARLGRAFPPS